MTLGGGMLVCTADTNIGKAWNAPQLGLLPEQSSFLQLWRQSHSPEKNTGRSREVVFPPDT
jgi:hypothetical protein